MSSIKALILAITMLSSESVNAPQINNYTKEINNITTNAILSACEYNMSEVNNTYDSIELNIDLPIIKTNYDSYYISVVGMNFHKEIYLDELTNYIKIDDLSHDSNYSISLYGIKDGQHINLSYADCNTIENSNNISDADISPELLVSIDEDILISDEDYQIVSIFDDQLDYTENIDRWTYINHYSKKVQLKGINTYKGTGTIKTIYYDEKVNRLNFKKQPKSYACIPTCISMLLNMEYGFHVEPNDIISMCYKNLNYQGLNYNDVFNLGNYINELYDKNLIINYFSDVCTYNNATAVNSSDDPDNVERLFSISDYNDQPVLWYNNSNWDNTVLLSRHEIDEKLFAELDKLLEENKLVIFRGKVNSNPVTASHVILIYGKDSDCYQYCDPINGRSYVCNRAYLEEVSKYHKGLMYFE